MLLEASRYVSAHCVLQHVCTINRKAICSERQTTLFLCFRVTDESTGEKKTVNYVLSAQICTYFRRTGKS